MNMLLKLLLMNMWSFKNSFNQHLMVGLQTYAESQHSEFRMLAEAYRNTRMWSAFNILCLWLQETDLPCSLTPLAIQTYSTVTPLIIKALSGS